MSAESGCPDNAPGDVLRHPLIISLLLLWALNDHVFKDYFGNEVTGKLSDVAGLAVFPLMLVSAYEVSCALLGREPRRRDWVLWASLAATGAFMIGINLSEPWAQVYTHGLSIAQWPFQATWSLLTGDGLPQLAKLTVTMDPTDLWTLPALSIAWWVAKP